MNTIILIVLILAGIVALLLLLALFAGKTYSIERAVVINQPRDRVFDYVRYLRNQDHYSKWVLMDPDMKKAFRETDGAPGFVYAWDGKKAGKGEQEIKTIVDGARLECELRFEKPFESVAQTHMTTETVAQNQTRVTWGMTGGNPYPFNLMHGMIQKMLGKDLEFGLNNLKTQLEKN